MTSDDPTPDSDRSQLSPKAITTRFEAVEAGDRLLLNDRDRVFEVVETSRYALTVVDPNGNNYTISQNLQTGGWSVHEDVWWVESIEPSDHES